jgi:hypothetical protein
VASSAQGLIPKAADADGNVTWTWRVGTRTTPGEWPIIIQAFKGDNEVIANTTFSVMY